MTKLAKLKDFVENNFPERLACSDYFDGQCFCIIGAMVQKVAPQFDFGSLMTTFENGHGIIAVFEDDKTDFCKFSKTMAEAFELTVDELDKFQEANDMFKGTREERSEHVKKFILDFIESKEAEMSTLA